MLANKKERKNMTEMNKLIMIIICIFGGAFGIHNFAMGETKKGIVKIAGTLLCGVVGTILSYIDLVKLAKDTYVIDPDAFI